MRPKGQSLIGTLFIISHKGMNKQDVRPQNPNNEASLSNGGEGILVMCILTRPEVDEIVLIRCARSNQAENKNKKLSIEDYWSVFLVLDPNVKIL